MLNLKFTGIVCQDEDGKYYLLSVGGFESLSLRLGDLPTGIITPPTPAEEEIQQEESKDLSLTGILKKNARAKIKS
jgi:hypothetical protein